VKIDDSLEETMVYVPEGYLEYVIPFEEEAVAYCPEAFKGKEHIVTLRLPEKEEIFSYRNLAKNAIDQRGLTTYYPHATANVETRDEAIFAAINVIDGIRKNKGHGVWPYQSWGTGERADCEIMVEFGRQVEVDKIAVCLRADFPHDTYWNEITILFSDESQIKVPLIKTEVLQFIEFDNKRISWVKIIDLKMADRNSDFAALRQIEVYGSDYLQQSDL